MSDFGDRTDRTGQTTATCFDLRMPEPRDSSAVQFWSADMPTFKNIFSYAISAAATWLDQREQQAHRERCQNEMREILEDKGVALEQRGIQTLTFSSWDEFEHFRALGNELGIRGSQLAWIPSSASLFDSTYSYHQGDYRFVGGENPNAILVVEPDTLRSGQRFPIVCEQSKFGEFDLSSLPSRTHQSFFTVPTAGREFEFTMAVRPDTPPQVEIDIDRLSDPHRGLLDFLKPNSLSLPTIPAA